MIIQTFSGQLLICCWGSPSQTRSTWTHLWGRAPCPCRGWGTARHRAPGPAWASPSRMSVVKDLCENYETSVLNSRCGKRKYWMLFRDWLILDVIWFTRIRILYEWYRNSMIIVLTYLSLTIQSDDLIKIVIILDPSKPPICLMPAADICMGSG